MSAALEAVFLGVAEMVKAQAQHTRAVAESDQQATALAHHHVGAAHHAFDHGVLAWAQLANGHNPGTVLIAQRQVEQHVLNVLKTDFRQLFSHGLADAFQRRDRDMRQLRHTVSQLASACALGRATEHRRIESARISMAFGRGKLARQAIATLVAQYVREVFLDVQRHLRGNPVQLRDQMRKEVRADGVDRANFEGGGQLILAGLSQFANALSLFKHLLRLSDDAFANRGQTYGALAALENQHTEFIFQLFDAHRQGRLADMAAFGGVAKVLLLSEGNDIAQFSIHSSIIPAVAWATAGRGGSFPALRDPAKHCPNLLPARRTIHGPHRRPRSADGWCLACPDVARLPAALRAQAAVAAARLWAVVVALAPAQVAVIHALVGLEEDGGVFLAHGFGIQHLADLLACDPFIAQVQALVRLDAQENGLLGSRSRFGCGRRQVDFDVYRRQRCCDHEDDQQHQHDVDERRYVDFVVFGELVVAFFQMQAHGLPHFYHVRRLAALGRRLVIQISADQQENLRRGVGDLSLVTGDGAGKDVVDDYGRDRSNQAQCSGQQCFSDAGCNHGKVGGLGFSDADEAVHDAPNSAEQAYEGRSRTDGGEHTSAHAHVAATGCDQSLKTESNAFLDAFALTRCYLPRRAPPDQSGQKPVSTLERLALLQGQPVWPLVSRPARLVSARGQWSQRGRQVSASGLKAARQRRDLPVADLDWRLTKRDAIRSDCWMWRYREPARLPTVARRLDRLWPAAVNREIAHGCACRQWQSVRCPYSGALAGGPAGFSGLLRNAHRAG
nr:hypothetical protein [Tanacetum cinerariifolium]